MGRSDELGDRVRGPDVPEWPSGPGTPGRDVCRYLGDRSL